MSERKRLKNKFNVAESYTTKSNYPGVYLMKEVIITGSMGKLSLAFEEAGRLSGILL